MKEIIIIYLISLFAILFFVFFHIVKNLKSSVYCELEKKYSHKYISEEEKNMMFENKLKELKSKGYKINYGHQSTGTISYTDDKGITRCVCAFDGYNSHGKQL